MEGVTVREFVFRRSWARGWLERESESTDMSLADSSLLELSSAAVYFRRFFFTAFAFDAEGFAHSGTG